MPRRNRKSRGRAAPPAPSLPPAPADDDGDSVHPRATAALSYETSTLRRVAVAVLCAKIALVVLVFDPAALNAFSQPKALVGHASAYILIGLLAAVALSHGRAMLRWSPLHVPVVVYVGAYLLATVFALDQRVALYGAPDRSLGLVSALDSVLVYVAVVALLRTRTDLLWLGSTLAGTTVLLLGYALLQKVGLDPVPWSSEIGLARPFATTGNPGVLGQYMATVVAGAGALAILTSRSAVRVALASAVVAACALVGALLAGARSSLFGVLAGGLVVGVSFAPRLRWRGRVLIVAGSFLSVIIVAAALLAAFGLRGQALSSGAIGEAFATAAAGGSVAGRLDIYRVAFEELRDRPLLGVGPDNYVVAYPRYRSPEHSRLHESDAPQTSTHSWFWKAATDAGILGLVSFLAVVLTGLALGIRQAGTHGLPGAVSIAAIAMLVAYLATGLFSIDHVATAWLPWIALGTIAVGPRVSEAQTPGIVQRRDGRRRRWRESSGWRRVSTAAVMLVALLLALSPIPAAQASHAARDAREASSQGEQGQRAMVSAAERAVASDPNRAEYWNLLGLAAFGVRDFQTAAGSFARASEIAPYEVTYLTNLAKAQFNLGLRGDGQARSDAFATAMKAERLAPDVAEVHYTLGLIHFGAGRPNEAVSDSERGLSIRAPSVAQTYEIAGRAYVALGRPADALRWLDMGLARTWSPPEVAALRLARVEVFLALERRADAAHDLIAAVRVVPDSPRAMEVRNEFTRVDTNDILLGESFRNVPGWTVQVGPAVGAVARNTLRPGVIPWRVVAGETWTDVRMSIQFRLTGTEANPGFFEIGRWQDSTNSIVVRNAYQGEDISIVATIGGSQAVIARTYLGPMRVGEWYWLEIDFNGPAVTAVLFRSGREPVAKQESLPIAVVFREVADPRVSSGVMTIANDVDSGIEIGGIQRAPGGAYVQRARSTP